MSFSMSRVYEGMEHAQKVMLLQQPLMTSISLSEETLPESPTKIDIKDLPKRFVPVHIYLHACKYIQTMTIAFLSISRIDCS